MLTAVNLGDDTDTVAAVTGGLAGLAYGLGLVDYDAETERLLLLNHGEAAVGEAERMVEEGCDDWYVQEAAWRNPLDVAAQVLRREAGL